MLVVIGEGVKNQGDIPCKGIGCRGNKHLWLLKVSRRFFLDFSIAFGRAWHRFILDKDGKISIQDRIDEGNPMTEGMKPLLTCDLWEHAYYLDYKNERKKYLEAFWKLINWEFFEENLR